MSTMTRIRIGPADHGRVMTLDEFLEAEEEEGYRYELARGVLEVTQVPDDPHGVIVCHFYQALSLYMQAHPGVIRRFGGGSEFRLWLPGIISGRNPDVAVALKGAPRDPRGDVFPPWPLKSSPTAAKPATTRPSARNTSLTASWNTGSSTRRREK